MAPLALSATDPLPGPNLTLPQAADVAPGSTVLVLSSPQSTSLRRGVIIWAAALATLSFVVGRVSKRSPTKKKKRSRR